MAKPLAVLIVEDVESDAQLIVRVLTKAGYTLTFERIETAALMRRALEKQTWDIVISDFSMPELDGHAALKLFQETGLDIPFIVVSGKMGEETAVSMMKAGVHDYVMKSNLARLVPAVERELSQAEARRERQRAEEALRASQLQHRTILQTAMSGFWLADLQGRLLEVNETYCRMSGYSAQELLTMCVPDLESGESARETGTHIQKVMAQGEDRFETQHRRKDGSIYDVEISVQYRPDEGGRLIAFLQDITERKRAEATLRDSEARYRTLFQGTADGILIADLESRMFRYANPAICRLLGYSEAELQTMGVSDIHPKADLPAVMAEFEAQSRGSKTLAADLPCLRKDGTVVYADVSAVAMSVDGRACNVGFFRDITERKQAEEEIRKRNEDLTLMNDINTAINRNESLDAITNLISEKVKDIFNGLGATLHMLNADRSRLVMKNLSISPALVKGIEKIIGISIPYIEHDLRVAHPFRQVFESGKSQLINDPESFQEFVAAFLLSLKSTDKTRARIRRVIPVIIKLTGLQSTMIVPLITDNGVIGTLDVSSREPFIEGDLRRLEAIAGLLTTVILRKETEDLLRESHELLSLFMKQSPIYTFIKTVNPTESRVLYASENFQDMIGSPGRDIVGKCMDELFPHEFAAKITADDWDVITKGEVLRLEEELNGRSYSSIKFPIVQGDRTLLAGYTIDITERKRAEQAVEVLSRFPTEDPNPVLRVKQNGQIIYANLSSAALLRLWNCTVGEYLPSDWRERVLNVARNNAPMTVEIECEECFYSILVVPIPNAGYVNIYGSDITKRKQAEEALRENEATLRAIIDAMPDLLFVVGLDGRYLDYHSIRNDLLAAPPEVFLGKLVSEVMPPDAAAVVMGALLEANASGQSIGKQFALALPQGQRWFELSVARKSTDLNEEQSFIVISHDITERKQADEKLRESEDLFRTAFESSVAGISMVAADGKFVKVNNTLCEILGYGQEELIHLHINDMTYEEDKEVGIKYLKQMLSGELENVSFEKRYIKKDRNVIWVILSISAIRDKQKEFQYFVAYTQDITERKIAVEKLRLTVVGTVNTIALIVEARDPYTSGHQKRVAEISIAIAKELGLPEDQIQGIYFASLIHDLGKIHVPSEILSKPGKFTKLEFDMIKTHSKVGYEILKEVDFPWPIAEIVYQHHERVNGSGYPRKLKGNRISIEAKIIGMADVIEAISSHRPYRPALGLDAALDEINKNKGILYDTDIVETFIKVIKKDKTLIPLP